MLFAQWVGRGGTNVYRVAIAFFNILSPQVSKYGLFTFGSAYTSSSPYKFTSTSSPNYIVAPFWSYIDIYTTGRVQYQTFTTGETQLEIVSLFIRRQMDNSFSGTWMLVAYWDSVPERYQSTSIVSGLADTTHIFI